jgi:hypothetical protein
VVTNHIERQSGPHLHNPFTVPFFDSVYARSRVLIPSPSIYPLRSWPCRGLARTPLFALFFWRSAILNTMSTPAMAQKLRAGQRV